MLRMKKVKIQAPAKINLHLHVGALRTDGFHDICSIFQAVSLFDDITLSLTGGKGEIIINGDFPCEPRKNLIWKAIEKFRELSGDDRGVAVDVVKRIPTEAGLGGGSSDAAAVLKSLVHLLDCHPGETALFKMAESLGSDVPFFLKYPSAFVTGRGEILEDAGSVPDLHGVLVKPAGEGISTGAAYARVDRARGAGILDQYVLTKEDMIDSYLTRSPREWPFYNSFMESYRNDNKPLEFISNLLYDAGAVFAGLTGSGSALFGLFESRGSATAAEEALSGQFPFVERIYFLHSIPDALVI